MQRCKLPPTARAVSKQLLLPNGRGLVRIPRRSFADSALPPPPPPSALKAAPKRHTFRRILLFSTLATGTFYVGSAFVAFNSRAYHDVFVEQVPFGTSVLQFAEEHDWDELDLDTLSDGVAGATAWAGRLVDRAQGKVPEPEKKAEAAAKDAALEKGAAAKGAALAKGAEAKDVVSSKASSAASSADAAASKAVSEKNAFVAKAVQAKESVKAAVAPVQEKVAAAVAPVKEKVVAATQALAGAPAKAEEKAAIAAHEVSDDVAHLVRKAEHVLAGKPIAELLEDAGAAVKDAVTTPSDVAQEAQGNVYSGPLPVGFEPPPGFSRPVSPKPKAFAKAPADGKDGKTAPAPEPLPLLAPAVAQLGASEPVISHLAGTIDTLASYLNSVPTASDQARAVLSTAQGDLEALAGRVDAVRKEETGRLEQELERQAQEYNSRVLQAEMEAQDRIDTQEDSFRKILDEERRNLVAAYREKLDKELATQSEIIDQRLKEEVIAQGIELQRRWVREIKVRVEAERGGRLARLDELAASLKKLESVALDNAAALDDTVRAHALWSALRAVHHAVDAPVRRPFRSELRVLRAAAGARDDAVVQAALGALEAGECADVGVEPLGALSAWFASSVAPRVESVALVPDAGAGVLSHLASHFVASFRFRRTGLVEGGDVLSVLARAEHYLAEKDLDSAAREVNQLTGVAKGLASDWMDAARRRLEVVQALEVLQSQATVASLLVV